MTCKKHSYFATVQTTIIPFTKRLNWHKLKFQMNTIPIFFYLSYPDLVSDNNLIKTRKATKCLILTSCFLRTFFQWFRTPVSKGNRSLWDSDIIWTIEKQFLMVHFPYLKLKWFSDALKKITNENLTKAKTILEFASF